MNAWFRVYNSLVDDPKVRKLPDNLIAALLWLWCIAAENDGVLPAIEDVAFKLRCTPAKAAEAITKLCGAGLLDNDGGAFRPHNWNGRQYKSDVSTERVKRYRDKKRNVSSTVSETPPEQSRAESEAEQSRANAARLKNEIEEKWGFLDTTRVDVWLATGYTETLIVATMTELLARKPGINGLAYFDAALAESHAKRPISRAETAAAIDWDGTIKLFVKTGVWSRWVGPEPGAAGSKAPHDILAKHGLGPDGQKLKVTA